MSPGTPPGPDAELDATKRASVVQLMLKCSRMANERALERLRSATGENLRPSHTALFPYISLQGTRQTELAEKLGISKQAVGQLVDELVGMDVLERIPDPSDGRAKLVCFVGGAEGIRAGMQVLLALDGELAQAVGVERYAAMRYTLLALEAYLESTDAAAGA